MNANELIEDLEDAGSFFEDSLYLKAAIMLRQQANRISELEKLVHQRFDDGKRLGVLETENKFKSPPCAWMVKTNDGKKLMLYGEKQPPKFADEVQVIPLYTHPVKELTDEEINKLWAESHEDGIAMQQGFTTQQHYFAHLILRKAQENG